MPAIFICGLPAQQRRFILPGHPSAVGALVGAEDIESLRPLHPFHAEEFGAKELGQMIGILAEDLHQQVKGSRDHHQVGDLLEGSDLACGDLRAGRLDDDADDESSSV